MQCMHNDITYDLQRGGAYIYECCERAFLATLPLVQLMSRIKYTYMQVHTKYICAHVIYMCNIWCYASWPMSIKN